MCGRVRLLDGTELFCPLDLATAGMRVRADELGDEFDCTVDEAALLCMCTFDVKPTLVRSGRSFRYDNAFDDWVEVEPGDPTADIKA